MGCWSEVPILLLVREGYSYADWKVEYLLYTHFYTFSASIADTEDGGRFGLQTLSLYDEVSESFHSEAEIETGVIINVWCWCIWSFDCKCVLYFETEQASSLSEE